MSEALDLDAYFERIRWGGRAEPTYETLASVLGAHMAAIPFENLDVLLKRRVRVDLEGVQAKLVGARRGGYCFEHATLFAAVLERLGFRPLRHLARVTMFVPRTAAARTHMFLTVALKEGTFVVDPGFGALAPRVPVPVEEGSEARSGKEVHRLGRDGRFRVMRVQTDKLVDAWFSTLEEEEATADFEMGNHYTSTHPDSQFVNRIMMRALTPDGRVGVMNRDVTIRRGDQVVSEQLADRRALRALLAEYFGFDLPGVEQLRVPSIPEWQ
jgi:N-hydroxyarylamine O-acetyltransferase